MPSKGIQSRIDLGSLNGTAAIRKIYHLDLPISDIHRVKNSLYQYQQKLAGSDLPSPGNLLTRVVDSQIGQLEVIDEYIEGDDIDTIINSDRYSNVFQQNVWKSMVRMMAANSQPDTTQTKIMLDAKPSNFCVRTNDHQIFYVDEFPPLLRGNDGLVSPYVKEIFVREPELMTFNFGDLRGQLTKLLALARLEYPQKYPELQAVTLRAIEDSVPTEVEAYTREQVRQGFPHNHDPVIVFMINFQKFSQLITSGNNFVKRFTAVILPVSFIFI